MKHSYSLFHINTSFSAVDTKNLKYLISKCYWPLLDLVEKNNFKISIESSGKSLIDINKIDKEWILKLRHLIKNKKCEFIGSGFAQIIGPAVPYEINYRNLEYGNEIYKKLLDFKPLIALVNEQAFSNSLISIYNKFYKAIIIDHLNHPFYHTDNHEPQILVDDHKNSIPVIWSNSVSFQRFQRYIFGDINLDDYFYYLKHYKNNFFCLYSSDAEIFDYRPKGKKSERPLYNNEWIKISNLYKLLSNSKQLKFFFFKDLLNSLNANKKIKLTSIIKPTIVKKQKKYNINRWLLAGKNNLELNTLCYRAFNSIKNQKKHRIKSLNKLCELWGSDFRSFVTKKKIQFFYRNITKLINSEKIIKQNPFFSKNLNFLNKNIKNFCENKNYIEFKNSNCSLILNKKKGLTIDSFIDSSINRKKLFGTIKQGSIKNSIFENDFFSSHYYILNKSNLKRYAGLSENKIQIFSTKNYFIARTIDNIHKNTKISKEVILNKNKCQLIINYNFKNLVSSYARINFITLNPEIFIKKRIFVKSNLGGTKQESFNLIDKNFNHGSFVENVGSIVTSNNSIPATKGVFIIGDNKKEIHFTIDQNLSCLIPMIEYEKKNNTYLFRLFFSAKESDETSCEHVFKNLKASIKIETKKI